MPDQQGQVTVPVADCLNVYFANGTYQSLPNPAAVSGGTLAGQCTGAFTFMDATGNPIPMAGVLNGQAYYWTGSAWASLLNTGFSTIAAWNFCEFGGQSFVQAVSNPAYEVISYFEAPVSATSTLYLVSAGGVTTPPAIVGASYGTVMAVVGQFVMIGDLAGLIVGNTIGTGNGSQTTFTSILSASVPIYPTSVTVLGGSGQFRTR